MQKVEVSGGLGDCRAGGLGPTIIRLGIIISVIGFIMLICQVVTCWWGKPDTCFFAPFILIILIGAVIAAVGYVFHHSAFSRDH